MAEALLRHRLDGTGVDAHVSSAGLLYDGVEASTGSVVAMARRQIDLTGHRSRILSAAHLKGTDLVLGMARMHVREAVVLDRTQFGRIFTLKEFVRRAERAGARNDEAFDQWLGHVAAGRRTADLLGEDPVDDIDDPIGGPQRLYERTATEISGLIDRVVALGWSHSSDAAGAPMEPNR